MKMSKITFEEFEYKCFGKCLGISNGTINIAVTLDFGPRVILYAFCGGENIMWEDTDGVFVQDYFGEKWRLYGGHRLWTSPESLADTYYPDNSPVEYEILKDGARFIQPPRHEKNIQCEFTVTLSETGTDVTVTHKIKNIGTDDIRFAVWGVTSLTGGGTEIIPQAQSDDIYSPNRLITFWPKTKITDERFTLGDKFMTLKHNSDNASGFKMGTHSGGNMALYFNHGDVFIKKYDYNKDGIYPDNNVPFETFTNQYFLEMETLGEYNYVSPGTTAVHREYWSLKKAELPCDPLEDFCVDTVFV